MTNPDGSWVYGTPYAGNYRVANGRHIMLGSGSHRLVEQRNDFSNTTRLEISPIKSVKLTGDFTYRLYQDRDTKRSNPMPFREFPGEEMQHYDIGAGKNKLNEAVKTRNYYARDSCSRSKCW